MNLKYFVSISLTTSITLAQFKIPIPFLGSISLPRLFRERDIRPGQDIPSAREHTPVLPSKFPSERNQYIPKTFSANPPTVRNNLQWGHVKYAPQNEDLSRFSSTQYFIDKPQPHNNIFGQTAPGRGSQGPLGYLQSSPASVTQNLVTQSRPFPLPLYQVHPQRVPPPSFNQLYNHTKGLRTYLSAPSAGNPEPKVQFGFHPMDDTDKSRDEVNFSQTERGQLFFMTSTVKSTTLSADRQNTTTRPSESTTIRPSPRSAVISYLTKRFYKIRKPNSLEVDCQGSNDLGFCKMSSKYPKEKVNHMMHECEEIVLRMFAEIPPDVDGLGDNSKSFHQHVNTKDGNNSLTPVKMGWSWAVYSYNKEPLCDSELKFFKPGFAQDITGQWLIVVQTDKTPQRIPLDICRDPDQPCRRMPDCGKKSRCVQRFNYHPLIAMTPNSNECPSMRIFRFPSGCVCHVQV